MTTEAEAMRLVAADLVEKIRPLLAGNEPEVIGCALAELLAILLAGHHPDLRKKLLKLHMQAVRDLVKPCEHELFAQRKRPKDWPPL